MSGAVRPKVGLARQATTCALFCIAALAVMAWRHPADLLAHARTALLASTRLARGLYMAHTLFAGLCLGLLFQHLGLLVAIGLEPNPHETRLHHPLRS